MDTQSKKHLHIISFDIPFPANYGGVIDVYHKIRSLSSIGIEVTLHCYQYGRKPSRELEALCKKVYYYKRSSSPIDIFSELPFIVKTRQSDQLLKNLLNDNDPILFEGLHSCAYLSHPLLKGRIKAYRESNIEHEYYQHLAKAENNLIKKLFFLIEARKLQLFEPILHHADLILTVSESDNQQLASRYGIYKCHHIPSFHGHDSVSSKEGLGTYCLYQGKLSVPENAIAAEYLITEVFAGSNTPLIIAGMDPSERLKQMIEKSSNITLIPNPDDNTMQQLTSEAGVHVMVTFQATGLKLKLLNTLYSGRHCLVNQNMVEGTLLSPLCHIENDPMKLREKATNLLGTPFTLEDIHKREIGLQPYDNTIKRDQLINLIWGNR